MALAILWALTLFWIVFGSAQEIECILCISAVNNHITTRWQLTSNIRLCNDFMFTRRMIYINWCKSGIIPHCNHIFEGGLNAPWILPFSLKHGNYWASQSQLCCMFCPLCKEHCGAFTLFRAFPQEGKPGDAAIHLWWQGVLRHMLNFGAAWM